MSERPEPSAALDDPRLDSSRPGGQPAVAAHLPGAAHRRPRALLRRGGDHCPAALCLPARYRPAAPRASRPSSRARCMRRCASARSRHAGPGLQPGIDIEQLTITDAHGVQALSIPHANAQLAWISIPRFELIFARLVVDAPDVPDRTRRRGRPVDRGRAARVQGASTIARFRTGCCRNARSCCAAARCAGATRCAAHPNSRCATSVLR